MKNITLLTLLLFAVGSSIGQQKETFTSGQADSCIIVKAWFEDPTWVVTFVDSAKVMHYRVSWEGSANDDNSSAFSDSLKIAIMKLKRTSMDEEDAKGVKVEKPSMTNKKVKDL